MSDKGGYDPEWKKHMIGVVCVALMFSALFTLIGFLMS